MIPASPAARVWQIARRMQSAKAASTLSTLINASTAALARPLALSEPQKRLDRGNVFLIKGKGCLKLYETAFLFIASSYLIFDST